MCKGRSLALVLEHRLREEVAAPGWGLRTPRAMSLGDKALLGPGWNLSSEPDSCIHLFEHLCVLSFQGLRSQAPHPGVLHSPHSGMTELAPRGLGRQDGGWSQRGGSEGLCPDLHLPAPSLMLPGVRRQQRGPQRHLSPDWE